MIPRRRRTYAVIIFTALIIILVNISWWFFYDRAERSLEEQLSRRLSSIAFLGAKNLSPFLLAPLPSDDLSGYELVLDILENIREADSLSEVFIIDHSYRYQVTTQTGADSVYYLAALNRAFIDSAFYVDYQSPVVTGSYRVGDILLKSAYIGLTDTLGIVSAMLGVEADIDYADDLLSLQRNLYLSGAVSIGGGILFGIFFFIIQRRISASEQALFLSQAQANLGRMVAVVSHEIKNPLMIIRASAEHIKKAGDYPEAKFILEETDRLNKIVTDYLGIAGGRRILQIGDVELKGFLQQIVEQFYQRLRSDGIDLNFRPPSERIITRADSSALHQVLINLILNAADAVRGKEKVQIELSAGTDGKSCRIIVDDNGPGITPEDLKHIFEPFYTTKTSGSGLGLFLSKKLVTEMKGGISVQSKTGGPTRFIIVLPSAEIKDA